MDKKRHKRKTSHAVHPPWICHLRKNVSPRKRLPAPLSAESNADMLRTVHPARESPRFRDFPRQDRLCRRMDRSPLRIYYITRQTRKQVGKAALRRKNRLPDALSSGWTGSVYRLSVHSGLTRSIPAVVVKAAETCPNRRNRCKKTPGAKTSGVRIFCHVRMIRANG